MATGTITTVQASGGPAALLQSTTVVWTSDASGAVDQSIGYLVGVIVGVQFTPSTGGTTPTTYAATLKDAGGYDVLRGQATGRSATVSERFVPVHAATDGTLSGYAPIPVSGELQLVISGAGNAKRGTLVVFHR